MFFGSDRKFFGNRFNLVIRDVKLKTAWRPLIGTHFTSYDDGAFLSDPVKLLKHFRRYGICHNHALNVAGAVAKNQELNFSGRTFVVQPAFDCDFLPFILADFSYINLLHKPHILTQSCRGAELTNLRWLSGVTYSSSGKWRCKSCCKSEYSGSLLKCCFT